MDIIPSQIMGYRHTQSGVAGFHAWNPATGKALPTTFPEATAEEINGVMAMAARAFPAYRKMAAGRRSLFLENIAAGLEGLGDELLQVIQEETALPLARLSGERSRTTGQLRLFARLLQEGRWNKEIVDEALPDRKPAARPEIIQKQVPLGVVVIFGASNFPLAFSVAGGDTAAALAAGCPVVFKAHPAHPATCQLVGQAIARAARETGMPEGVFSMLHGCTHETGGMLVTHPHTKAVAFTGSFKGGKSLYDLAVRRTEPIPVYAEMGSVNPVFFLPEAVSQGGEALAVQYAQSVTLGSGQFCTNPGVSVFMNNEASRLFIQKIADTLSATSLHPLLTPGITRAYQSGLEKQKKLPGAHLLTTPSPAETGPAIISVSASDVLQHVEYFEEVFGPSALAVLADSYDDMYRLAEAMPGQLTGTIHAAGLDFQAAGELAERLTYKAGRVLMNGFPTGVEVCAAMVHGGPYPATTDSRVTSVGTTSIYRFTRPVCYQNFPHSLLPVSG